MSPLDTVLRLMPPEYHTGGLSDPDPLVRLWAVGHAMGYLAGLRAAGERVETGAVSTALAALRSQAQREADRGHA